MVAVLIHLHRRIHRLQEAHRIGTSRNNRTPEENTRRAKICELPQDANISGMADIQSLFRETIAEFMENGLEAELNEKLGYNKFDFHNKETANSRKGYSRKKLKISFGDTLRWIGRASLNRYCSGKTEPAPARASKKDSVYVRKRNDDVGYRNSHP